MPYVWPSTPLYQLFINTILSESFMGADECKKNMKTPSVACNNFVNFICQN